MEDFLMIIYNRWGDIVYKAESTDEIMDVETGWNGKIRIGKTNNVGPLATPGVYIYFVKAHGKDKNEYWSTNKTKNIPENSKPEETKGFIRLFR